MSTTQALNYSLYDNALYGASTEAMFGHSFRVVINLVLYGGNCFLCAVYFPDHVILPALLVIIMMALSEVAYWIALSSINVSIFC